MRANQLKWGSLLSYLQMFLSVVISLVYTPVMTNILGKSEFGLYNTVSSTISMLSILSLGFGSSYIRYFAKYKAQDDKESIYKLNGLFLIVFSIIGAVALVCGLFLSENLHLVFDEGLTRSEYDIAKILMILLTINLAISFPATIFSNIILAHEKFIFSRVVNMIRTICSPLVTMPLLLIGFRSVAIVTVTLVLYLIADAVNIYYVFFKIKDKFIFKNFEKGLFASLFVYTSFIAINIITDQINWNVGKLMLGRFSGTGAVAVYSVGYTLHNFYQTFSTSVSGVFAPRIHTLVNNAGSDKVKLRASFTELFTKIGRIQFLLLALVASGVVFFGKQFIVNLWVGSEYEESYLVAVWLMLPATIPLIQNAGIEMQRALNLHKFRSLVYLCMAGLNLVITYFTCRAFGAVGATIGTAISMIAANGVVMNIYYQRKCCIDVIFFWKNIFRMSLGLIPPILIGILINKHINTESIFNLLLGIVLYTIVYCISMWLISMNRFEKDIVIKPIKKLLRK